MGGTSSRTGNGGGTDALDDAVRRRLAEIMAAAGVPHAQIALEVLYYLPKAFLDQYSELFTKALKADGGESARNGAQQDNAGVGKAETPGNRGGAKQQTKRYKRTFVVLDERALDLKGKIDSRLRGMAREIALDLAGGGGSALRTLTCTGCGSFMQLAWKYCPKCGNTDIPPEG